MQKSFTLIELLVVIAIIGILAGTIIVNMSGATDKATIAKSQSFASSVRSALGAGMVSEYRFDGTGVAEGGSATSAYYTDTWSQNNATATNNPTVLTGTNCISGSCLNFNGTDQCIHVADNPSLNFSSEMTVMAWVKEWNNGAIISQGDLSNGSFYITFEAYNSVDSITFNVSKTGAYDEINSIVAIYPVTSDSKWHLIGFSLNAGTPKVYFNGESVPITVNGSATTINNVTTDLTIGCLIIDGDDSYFLPSKIDDLQIYNKAIPTAQIKSMYYAGLNKLLANKQITDEEYFTRTSKLEQHSATK